MRTPLSQKNLVGIMPLHSFTPPTSFTPLRLRTLKLSCTLFPDSGPLFSIASAPFDKNTGGVVSRTNLQDSRVAYPSPSPIFTSHGSPVTGHALRRAQKTQKCVPVSPFVATLTHSLSRRSFACHSYANTRDGCRAVLCPLCRLCALGDSEANYQFLKCFRMCRSRDVPRTPLESADPEKGGGGV
jgi:hypothetical protein